MAKLTTYLESIAELQKQKRKKKSKVLPINGKSKLPQDYNQAYSRLKNKDIKLDNPDERKTEELTIEVSKTLLQNLNSTSDMDDSNLSDFVNSIFDLGVLAYKQNTERDLTTIKEMKANEKEETSRQTDKAKTVSKQVQPKTPPKV